MSQQKTVTPSLFQRAVDFARTPKGGELIRYVVIGGLTTAVNWGVYFSLTLLFHMHEDPAQWISEISSIVFAYAANKGFVFRTRCPNKTALMKEMGSFFGARAVTSGLASIGVHVFVVNWGWSDIWVKPTLNVLVLLLNYVASKLFIFEKKNIKSESSEV